MTAEASGAAGTVRNALCCFRVELAAVSRVAAELLTEGGGYAETRGPLRLDRLDEPEPDGSMRVKVALYAPRALPGTTVLVSNLADGAEKLVKPLSARLSTTAWRFLLSSRPQTVYQTNEFELVEGGKVLRHVSLRRETNWKFRKFGKPLPEEDTEPYGRPGQEERFSRAAVLRLAARLGFPIEDERFWQSDEDAVQFEETGH